MTLLQGKLRPQIRFAIRQPVSPQFAPGSVHIAHFSAINPTTKAWDYRIEVTGWPWGASPASWPSVHLEPGQRSPLDCALTMPSAAGSYPFKLHAWADGEDLGETTLATVRVAFPVAPAIEFGAVTWD